jgi:hypothetical protein
MATTGEFELEKLMKPLTLWQGTNVLPQQAL